jgi:hypothetical protein
MGESRIIVFARCYLSTRTFELVVEPALADLQYDEECGGRSTIASRVAVLRAVAGALCDELRRDAVSFFTVALVPAAYYAFMMAVCLDAFRTWSEFFGTAALIVVMSFFPVVVCFWPRRAPFGADAPTKAAASVAD